MAQIARLKDAEITNGNIINADDLDAEFNQLVSESNGQDTRLTTIESGAFSKSGVMTFLTTPKMDAISPVTTNGATSLTLAGAGVNAQTGTTYTVLTGDRYKLVTFSNASPVAVTLPQAGSTGFGNSFEFEAKNIGVGTVTITPTTSTIDGAATATLTTNQSMRVYSNGTNYFTSVGKSSPSTLEYLGTSGAISAAATVDFTTAGWFASTYQSLLFECIRVKPANDGVSLYMLASVDGGTNWLGASTYDYINNGRNTANTAKSSSAAAAARIIPHTEDTIGNDTNEWYSGEILLKNPFATVYKDVGWSSNHQGTGNVLQSSHGRGRVLTNSAINGIRFLMSAGNIASGEIKVYGLRAS
jgi:hypothetical protein